MTSVLIQLLLMYLGNANQKDLNNVKDYLQKIYTFIGTAFPDIATGAYQINSKSASRPVKEAVLRDRLRNHLDKADEKDAKLAAKAAK